MGTPTTSKDVWDKIMNELVLKLIKAGKTAQGIRAIAGSSMSPCHVKNIVPIDNVKLQALEVVRVINLADEGKYNNYINTQQYKITTTIDFVLEDWIKRQTSLTHYYSDEELEAYELKRGEYELNNKHITFIPIEGVWVETIAATE